MILKLLLVFLICVVNSMHLFSQTKGFEKANQQYANYAYIDAIKTYERLLKKGFITPEILQKLGNSYFFNSNYEKANYAFTLLFKNTTEIDIEYYFRYAQTLKSIGNFTKADAILSEAVLKKPKDARSMFFKNNPNYLNQIHNNSGRYVIENCKINSKYSDYGTAFFQNKLLFSTSRDTGSIFRRIFKWDNQSFSNLYEATLKSDGTFDKPKPFSALNSKFNEATPVFTKDGKTVYFSRNNYNNGKKGKNNDQSTLLKLYKATFENGKWTDVVELPFNSDQFSTAHPALSSDEKTLYFASDRPGTFGQSDLYKVAINKNGSFGKPINLGSAINTPGKETFPFVTDENELYFSSDGHPGLGGLDVFVTPLNSKIKKEIPQNIGEPINGPDDDFGFYIDTKLRIGYFSSNRKGGMGMDDIYKFQELKKLNCQQSLRISCVDFETNQPLVANVFLFDTIYTEIQKGTTDENGNVVFEIPCNSNYTIRVSNENYTSNEKSMNSSNEINNPSLSFSLEKIKKQIQVGDDLAKKYGIQTIYFDLDKSIIRDEAAVELAKILDVLEQNPTMCIAIKSHTDSRQTSHYNEDLSERRAKATHEWLVGKGINPARMTFKGYGETQLVNNCSDGIECSEAQHQANRRSEFIIISL